MNLPGIWADLASAYGIWDCGKKGREGEIQERLQIQVPKANLLVPPK